MYLSLTGLTDTISNIKLEKVSQTPPKTGDKRNAPEKNVKETFTPIIYQIGSENQSKKLQSHAYARRISTLKNGMLSPH
ncbi:hypothetical protein [Microviridae sp.]|nr:hypothetical protein [Microviridae sp.]